jgi:hypothetical protein
LAYLLRLRPCRLWDLDWAKSDAATERVAFDRLVFKSLPALLASRRDVPTSLVSQGRAIGLQPNPVYGLGRFLIIAVIQCLIRSFFDNLPGGSDLHVVVCDGECSPLDLYDVYINNMAFNDFVIHIRHEIAP